LSGKIEWQVEPLETTNKRGSVSLIVETCYLTKTASNILLSPADCEAQPTNFKDLGLDE
jgi:hypothetical protein